MKISITGPVVAFDDDENEIVEEDRLAAIDGWIVGEESCSKYFDESLDDIGITGGEVRIRFDQKSKRLRVFTEYQSPRQLTDAELKLLVDETCGQWSDGIGEGADHPDAFLDLWPHNASRESVVVEQIDDGTRPKRKRKSPLFNAAKKGDVAKLAKHLDEGEEPSPADRYGMTPLHIAIREGHTEAARLLIERGADIDRFDETGWTPLTCAAVCGNVEIARLLLERGADVNRQLIDDTGAQSGYAPLMMACHRKQFDVGKLLLEHGADPNIRDFTGYTPLMCLDKSGVEFARVLVEYGADLTVKNRLRMGVKPSLIKQLNSDT